MKNSLQYKHQGEPSVASVSPGPNVEYVAKVARDLMYVKRQLNVKTPELTTDASKCARARICRRVAVNTSGRPCRRHQLAGLTAGARRSTRRRHVLACAAV